MKKKISIICSLMIIILNSLVYASTLNLDVKSDKAKVEKDEEITITMDWKENMQAADFILKFDDSKFDFVSMDLEDTFYSVNGSELKVVWVSIDDIDKTSMEAKFKAKKSGKAIFETKIDGGFATGDLVIPTDYQEGKTIVKVKGNESIMIIGISIVVLVGIIIGIVKRKK